MFELGAFYQLCSMTLLSAVSVILRSATKITHKAQAITGLAAKWHVCATLDSFDGVVEGEISLSQIPNERMFPTVGTDGESESDEAGDEEDDINNTKLIPAYAYSTISYQKRQALGMLNNLKSHSLSLCYLFLFSLLFVALIFCGQLMNM